MRYALLLAVLVVMSAQAKADSLMLGAWSKHIASDYDYNEQHNLVAYQRDKWVAGYFKNSYNRDTFFVARDFSVQTWAGKFGILAGATRGYTFCYGDDGSGADVCPMITPYWEPFKEVTPRFSLMGNALTVSGTINF